MEAGNFRNIVTGEKRWFTRECQHSAKWSVCRDDVPEKGRHVIGTRKLMPTVIWRVNGFHVADLMTSQRTLDSGDFVNQSMTSLTQKVLLRGRNPHARRRRCHLANCRAPFSRAIEQFITQNHILHVDHPPCSPDRAPSDFWLFGHVKKSLVGQGFKGPEHLREGIIAFLEEIQP
jgi:hypothetical protein